VRSRLIAIAPPTGISCIIVREPRLCARAPALFDVIAGELALAFLRQSRAQRTSLSAAKDIGPGLKPAFQCGERFKARVQRGNFHFHSPNVSMPEDQAALLL